MNRIPVAPIRLNPDLPVEWNGLSTKHWRKTGSCVTALPPIWNGLKRLRRDTESGRTSAGIFNIEPSATRSTNWWKWSAILAFAIVAAVAALLLRSPLSPPKIIGSNRSPAIQFPNSVL